MTIKGLIGYQLVSIDDESIVVKKGDSIYKLLITEDYGDCCGYNELSTKLLISNDELNRNPVITNVILESEEDGYGEYDKAKVTFFGEFKPLAELDSLSSSGSGWCYGACVTIECDVLDMYQEITRW